MASSSSPVLIDTNFVLSCYRFKIPLDEIHRVVEEKHHIVVPENVLTELKNLPLTGCDREGRTVMLAILEKCPTVPLEGPVDRSLLDYAAGHTCIICTNDRILRKALKRMGTRVIMVKAQSHLVLD
ncbi:MAG: PIN domain-containing protein [Candidatus Methanofastidiosia archaeon]